ncbi:MULTISPECIES: hypothetical protein [unclassified Mucilaginibacter]|uniref:hypothetical protein n=1 Tax=unclassified Mucilaginibacter TaxID=2617802 RepID=UPI0031F71B49
MNTQVEMTLDTLEGFIQKSFDGFFDEMHFQAIQMPAKMLKVSATYHNIPFSYTFNLFEWNFYSRSKMALHILENMKGKIARNEQTIFTKKALATQSLHG